MGKSGTSHLLSYSLEKTSTCVWQNGDRFPIQNICSPYKTLLYTYTSSRGPFELQQTKLYPLGARLITPQRGNKQNTTSGSIL